MRQCELALALWIGKTRLIDNVLCEPPAARIKYHQNLF